MLYTFLGQETDVQCHLKVETSAELSGQLSLMIESGAIWCRLCIEILLGQFGMTFLTPLKLSHGMFLDW